jgi:hypothetical protein
MLRVRFTEVCIVSSALVSLALSAQGGNFNRPDVLDVNDSSKYTNTGETSLPYSQARMYAEDTTAQVFGTLIGSARDADNRVRVVGWLYQPDTVKRNHKMAKANQKRYMFVKVEFWALPGGTRIGYEVGYIEKCKGLVKAQDKDKDEGKGSYDLSPTGKDTIKAKLKCPRDVLEQLGFSADDVDTIQRIIGKSTRWSVKLP